jgi:hypothetical protein
LPVVKVIDELKETLMSGSPEARATVTETLPAGCALSLTRNAAQTAVPSGTVALKLSVTNVNWDVGASGEWREAATGDNTTATTTPAARSRTSRPGPWMRRSPVPAVKARAIELKTVARRGISTRIGPLSTTGPQGQQPHDVRGPQFEPESDACRKEYCAEMGPLRGQIGAGEPQARIRTNGVVP